MATIKNEAKKPTVEELLKMLQEQGYDTNKSIEAQKVEKALDGLKKEFKTAIDKFQSKFKDSNIKSVLIRYNDNGELEGIQYGQNIIIGNNERKERQVSFPKIKHNQTGHILTSGGVLPEAWKPILKPFEEVLKGKSRGEILNFLKEQEGFCVTA